jgi:exodeoxyribonuclease V alpha subunit
MVALSSTKSGTSRIQHFVPSQTDPRIDARFATEVIRGYQDFLSANTPQDAFQALHQFRVLCALRNGPLGVIRLNQQIEEILAGKHISKSSLPAELQSGKRLVPNGEAYSHRVVLITRNDNALELYNGDIGIMLPDTHDESRIVTWFENRDQPVPVALLPEHETGFAMTIHKAQGSEFGNVMILLPSLSSPILTKELIYTAITRTRQALQIWCEPDILKSSIAKNIRRATGLLQQLEEHAHNL